MIAALFVQTLAVLGTVTLVGLGSALTWSQVSRRKAAGRS